MLSRQDLSVFHPQANEISQELKLDPAVTPNVAGVRLAQQRFHDYLSIEQEAIQSLKHQISTDYDGFLAGLTVDRLLAHESEKTAFVSSFFEGNPVVIDQIRQQEHPMSSYLRMNKIFVDGFTNAMKQNSAADLNMHEVRYEELKRYLHEVGSSVEQAQEIFAVAQQSSARPATIPLYAHDGTHAHTPVQDATVQAPPEVQLAQAGGSA